MYTRAEKTKEQESRAAAYAVGNRHHNGTQGIGLVDNRAETNALQCLHPMAHGSLIQSFTPQKGKSHFKKHTQSILQLVARPKGISTKLARARWRMKKRTGVTFKQWKRGYEAQHIIPWAVANKLGLPMKYINLAFNGMMLPSGRKHAADPVYKATSRFLERPRHIKIGGCHKEYSKNVELYIMSYMKRKKRTTLHKRHMKRIARRLRRATKQHPATGYIQDMQFPDA